MFYKDFFVSNIISFILNFLLVYCNSRINDNYKDSIRKRKNIWSKKKFFSHGTLIFSSYVFCILFLKHLKFIQFLNITCVKLWIHMIFRHLLLLAPCLDLKLRLLQMKSLLPNLKSNYLSI